ncbi:MAG: pyridoxal phosphate-dependent aminotransferase [Planctomycetota bacterium]|nr:pyridoxal phosphate-dependent aminotransferase [Planctomycetota bacterium]
MPTDETPAGKTPADPHPASRAVFGGAPLPYMRWAKRWLMPDPLSLGLSGLPPLPADQREELGLSAPSGIGDPWNALKSALAERYGLGPENVLPAAGTSHANFLVYLTLARQGHVVVETPAYEPLPCLAAQLGASVATARRDPERGWRFDPDSLERALRPETALIALTDLHNPTGARLHAEDLELIVEAAERTRAYVLIDEVYADFDPLDRPTSALRSRRIVTTNSLTKAHGLPDLRAGYILGAPSVIRSLDEMNDLVHPSLPPTAMADAARYVPRARALLERTRALAAERTALVDEWVSATDGVRWTPPDGGITGLLCFEEHVDGDEVAARLGDAHGVRAVPGSFFQVPSAVRVSFLLREDDLRRALDAIASVLGELR